MASQNLLSVGAISGDTPHQTFNFDHLPVRTVNRDGEIWFVAADVCAALELANPRQVVSRLDDDEKGVLTVDTLGGPQEVVVISESGLYSLILTSRKEEAKRFKRWITHEVLPAIRKTGGYGSQDTERLKLAFALASEVANQAARTVFDSVMAGDDGWKHDRWMFSLTYDRDNKPTVPWAKAIDRDAMVVSLADLPRRLLEPNGMLPSNKELADLAAACNQRLAQRMAYEASKASATGVMKP
ncbi:MAG: Bro-N domain-containing protein [Brachymonas sp.]